MKKVFLIIVIVFAAAVLPAISSVPRSIVVPKWDLFNGGSGIVTSGDNMAWNNADVMLWNNGDTMLWN